MSIIYRSKIDKFLGRYKKLKIHAVTNTETGKVDFIGTNSQKREVLIYRGRKSSILLLNHLYTVNKAQAEWLDPLLQELANE